MAPEPEDDIMNEKNPRPLDEDDIALLKTYVRTATPVWISRISGSRVLLADLVLRWCFGVIFVGIWAGDRSRVLISSAFR